MNRNTAKWTIISAVFLHHPFFYEIVMFIKLPIDLWDHSSWFLVGNDAGKVPVDTFCHTCWLPDFASKYVKDKGQGTSLP